MHLYSTLLAPGLLLRPLLAVTQVAAEPFIPAPENTTKLNSRIFTDVSISYKQVETNLCISKSSHG